MPFYIRLGPHGVIIAIGACLHARWGRFIYRQKRRKFARIRQELSAGTAREWTLDPAENLTPSSTLVQIVRHNHRPGRSYTPR